MLPAAISEPTVAPATAANNDLVGTALARGWRSPSPFAAVPLRCVAIWVAVLLSSVLVEAGPVRATERIRTVRVEREHGFAAHDALLGAAAAAVVIALVATATLALERRRSSPKGRTR